MLQKAKNYAIEKHQATGHKYDDHNYDFHLLNPYTF